MPVSKLSILGSCILVVGILTATPLMAGPTVKVGTGHASEVVSLALSPGGEFVLSGSYDDAFKLWETESGREIRSMRTDPDCLVRVAFSPDGKHAASAGYQDASIKVWNALTWEEPRILRGHGGAIDSLAFSQDGRTLVSACWDKTIKLWDCESGRLIRTISGFKNQLEQAAFSPDGRLLIVVEEHGVAAQLWDAGSGIRLKTFAGHEDAVYLAAFSPDGRSLLSASRDGTLRIWNTASGGQIRSLESGYSTVMHGPSGNPIGTRPTAVSAAAYSPDGRWIAAAYYGQPMLLWEAATGERIRSFDSGSDQVTEIAFFPDGRRLLAGSEDGRLTIWDAATGKRVREFKGSLAEFGPAFYSRDGRTLLTVSGGDLVGWDASSGRKTRSLPGELDECKAITFSPDRRTALVGAADGKLHLLDAVHWKTVKTLAGHPREVDEVALSPDGRHAVSVGFDETIKLWDIRSGVEIRTFDGDSFYGAISLEFSPDGSRVLVLNGQNELMVWDANTGKQLLSYEGTPNYPYSACFSPDGKEIIGSFVNRETGEYFAAALDAGTGRASRRSAAFSDIPGVFRSSDDRVIVQGRVGGKVHLLEAGGMKRIAVLALDDAYAAVLDLAPGGKKALVAAGDNTLRQYDLATGAEMAASLYDGGEWLTWEPGGCFTGSPHAMRESVYLVDGLMTYSIDQFFETYYRPDLIAARLQGQGAGGLVQPDLAAGFAAPPAVSISVKSKSGVFQEVAGDLDLSVPAGAGAQAPPWLVSGGSIVVRVSAKDSGGGVDGLRLFNTGKAIGEEVRGLTVVGANSGGYEKDFVVPLHEGDNLLQAVGFSRDRTESTPRQLKVLYAPARVEKARLFVLAAGADTYRNSRYNLNFALADTKGFVETLRTAASSLFTGIQVLEYYEKDLTAENLRRALKTIQAQARPQDVFILFYAGHGIALPEGRQNIFYFVLPGVTVMNDVQKLKEQAFNTAELRDLVAGIPANKQMLLVDACNSGAFLEGFAMRGAAEENALAQLQRSAGMALFSASTDTQYAAEVKEIGHGLFTWVLMQGLRGEAAARDGRITAASLKAYLDESVPLLSQKYRGNEQFPQALISGQDFPIGMK